MESDRSKNGDFGDWLDGDTGELDNVLEGVDLDSFGEDFEDVSSLTEESTNTVPLMKDVRPNIDQSFAELAGKRMGSVLFPELKPQWDSPTLVDGVDDNPLNEVYRVDDLLEQTDSIEETLDDFGDLPKDLIEDFEDLPEESEDLPAQAPPTLSSVPVPAPLGSAVQEDDTDLSLEVLEQVESVSVHDQIDYPCMVIDGLTTVEEAQFLHGLKPSSEMALPLYCSIDGTIKRIGTSELTIKYLQILNYLGDYGVFIMKSAGAVSPLDLKDVNTYLKLITL